MSGGIRLKATRKKMRTQRDNHRVNKTLKLNKDEIMIDKDERIRRFITKDRGRQIDWTL